MCGGELEITYTKSKPKSFHLSVRTRLSSIEHESLPPKIWKLNELISLSQKFVTNATPLPMDGD